MGTIPPQKIATAEEFARADAAWQADSQLYANLRDHILSTFCRYAPLHNCYFFGRPDTGLEACIFYKSESDVLKYQENGVEQAIRDSLLAKIESLSKIPAPEFQVKFSFLSDEAVQKKCNGNYHRFFS